MDPLPVSSVTLHRTARPKRQGVRLILAVLVAGLLVAGCIDTRSYCSPCPNPKPESYRRIARSFADSLGVDDDDGRVTIEREAGVLCSCPYADAIGSIDSAPEVFIEQAVEQAKARGFRLVLQTPQPLVAGAEWYRAALQRGDTELIFIWDDYREEATVSVHERPFGRTNPAYTNTTTSNELRGRSADPGR